MANTGLRQQQFLSKLWGYMMLAVVVWLLAMVVSDLWQGQVDRVLTHGSVPNRAAPNEVSHAAFELCRGRSGGTCVVDGDTIHFEGVIIRIADIDTPEVGRPQCAFEKELGDRATLRMIDLLNAGPIEIADYARDEDRYGRKLRIVRRDGQSLGEVLVAEGLARRWDGARHSWCG